MNRTLITIGLGVFAGVAAGASGLFQLRRPHPGWLFAALEAVWLLLLYAGTWRV